eukprot:scaffold5742_cov95-Isochrysis_galbana.AAC.7
MNRLHHDRAGAGRSLRSMPPSLERPGSRLRSEASWLPEDLTRVPPFMLHTQWHCRSTSRSSGLGAR